MKIGNNTHVTLTYELRVDGFEGKIIERVGDKNPLAFVYGDGSMLASFEQKLQGLEIGEEFKFNIPADEAYGLTDDNAVVEIPLEAFEINGKVDYEMVKAGNFIPMRDEHGHKLNGLVVAFDEKTVKMDFNHPLAGEELFFSGKVSHVRETVEEDFHHHHSCSCGGGCDC